MSHKNDVPSLSKQSFVDSSISGPPSTASIPEPWTSQRLEDPSYGPMRSPERSYRAHSSKRSSVFTLRSRSNTGASTTSTILSSSPVGMSNYDASRPGTPLTHNQHGPPGHDEQPGSRRSLFRGKKGKRLSESVSSIVLTEYQDRDTGDKRMSVLRKVRRRNNQPEQPCRLLYPNPTYYYLLIMIAESLKHRISSPFDFQHLTHTDRQQYAAFERSSGDKLAPGLPAGHALQQSSNDASRTRPDDQHFPNFSSESLAAQDYRSPSAMSLGSPPQSPKRFNRQQQSVPALQDTASRPSLRLTRSVESFSQPGVSFRNHHHSQSVLAPPRLTSLSLLASIDDAPDDSSFVSTRPRTNRESGVWDSFSLARTPDEPQLAGTADYSSYFGHALTTPDDTALPAMPTSFSPSLDDVAEEPERFFQPRTVPRPPPKGPTTPKSPHFDTSIFNEQQPIARARNRGNSSHSPRSHNRKRSTSRPISQMSDTLGSLEPVRRASVRKPSTKRRQSNTWRAPEGSWEDDVDYIYEHALEADCDLDWDRASDEIHAPDQSDKNDRRASEHSIQQPVSSLQPAFEPSVPYQPRDFRVSLLVPDVPELVPTSATSVSTMAMSLKTPCDSFHGRPVGDVGGFIVSPSLLVPREYKDDQEEHSYDDLLSTYDDSDRHFPMLDPRYSATSSARSRRSSYDSSLVSSAQSSGLWSSPVRRSASSTGSIPDLVPSRHTRRDLSFSLVVDQLTDSVASLSHLDEDSVTPPGQVAKNRTSFPTEDSEDSVDHRTVIEDELRASLELARRGSYRSRHAPVRHHKHAMSDGVTKLLTMATTAPETQLLKPRSRAATASQSRSPMLSLFPAPPRHSPNPGRM
jgi:hypothetical protein